MLWFPGSFELHYVQVFARYIKPIFTATMLICPLIDTARMICDVLGVF